MENLKRYSERLNKFGVTQLLPTGDGEYVKFSDIAEALNPSHNKQSTPCLCSQCPSFKQCVGGERFDTGNGL